ncbi:MAG: hypothetical protein AB8G95_14735 [Anaerolineae bacterium]
MKSAVPMFVIALMILAWVYIRLPDTVRNVDALSLLGAGALIGALVVISVRTAQDRR